MDSGAEMYIDEFDGNLGFSWRGLAQELNPVYQAKKLNEGRKALVHNVVSAEKAARSNIARSGKGALRNIGSAGRAMLKNKRVQKAAIISAVAVGAYFAAPYVMGLFSASGLTGADAASTIIGLSKKSGTPELSVAPPVQPDGASEATLPGESKIKPIHIGALSALALLALI